MKKRSDKLIHYVKNPDVVLREEGPEGALLFNPDTNQIKVLNPTGVFIWKLCDGKHDLSSMIDSLKESFDKVPEKEAKGHVEKFIEEMVNTGCIGIPEK